MNKHSLLETKTDLSGKVAIVTGASRGIGRVIALSLAASGATVAVGSRDLEANKALAREIENLSGTCLAGPCDVRNEASIASFIKSVTDRYEQVDILVNNAGVYKTQPVRGHDLSLWNEILETNLTGAMISSRSVLDSMIARNWGRIVNISSISGKVAEAFGSAYSASKFGLIGLTQALALEVAKFGITVNAICPAWVETRMAEQQLTDPEWLRENSIVPAESHEIARLSIPQMRFIEAEEIASLVTYLCTHAARGITGQAINICGGLSLH